MAKRKDTHKGPAAGADMAAAPGKLEEEIAERRRTEELLRSSEERWKFAIEGSGAGLWDWDAQTNRVFFSAQWKAMLGFAPHEIGDTLDEWEKRVHPDDLARVYAEVNRHLAGETPLYTSEHRLLCKDGTYKWILDRGKVISRTPEGKPLRVIGTHTDLTALKQAEELIRVQRDLGAALSSTSHLYEALNLVLGAGLKMEGVDCGGIYLADPTTGALDLAVHAGLSHRFVSAVSRYGHDSPQVGMIREGRPIYGTCDVVRQGPEGAMAREKLRAVAFVPVLYGGRLVAVLNFASHARDEIPRATCDAIETVATRVGGVIARIRAEEAQRESRQNLQTLFDTLDDMLFILDSTGLILMTNPVVQQRLGYTPEELASMHVLDVHPPGQRQEAAAIVADMIAGRASMYSIPLMARDGTQIPVETKVARGTWGGRDVLFGISRDVTERRRAEELVRQSEERYRELVENATDVIYETDAKGYVRYVNQSTEKLLGYTSGEMAGRHYLDFLPPGHREAQSRLFDIQFAKKIPTTNHETPVFTRDGRTVWLWQNVNLVTDGDAVTGFHVIARDVTDRKLAEEALREREATLRTITASAHDAIIMIDDHGIITFWNEAAEQIFGWGRAEALGRDLHLLLAPERSHADYARAMEHFRGSGLGGAVGRTLELPAIRKDGSEVPIELSLSAVQIAGAWHGVGIMRDITERKKAEAERMELDRRLQQAQKLESLGVLAGGIAHDFNNLLMGVLGNLDLSLLDLPRGSRTRTLVEKAMTSAYKAADLTRQMLAYSGKGRYVAGRVNVNDLIRQSEVLIRSAIPRAVSLELALASQGAIEADADQVRQVIMNLVTNAYEAIGDAPGSITLRTGDMDCDAQCLGRSRIFEKPPEGRFVFVEVTDTGCGMDEETRRRLFDPFFSTKFTGRGLGMSAVLGIVSTHGGAILVDSAPGRGSSIRVLFPAVEAAAVREAAGEDGRPEAGRATGAGKILVVDDEQDVREVCSVFVEHLGYDAIPASDGAEGVHLFQRHAGEIVCVLLDLTMPKLDGIGAYQKMREIRTDIPVILSSGYSEQDLSGRYSNLGLAGFIQKPYTLSELKKKIEQALHGKTPA